MAGFGNIFNFDKPGPGVDKNAPKKAGFALFKEIFFEKFWNFIPLSLLYIVMCLPVVTVGLADVGIAYITRNFARRKSVFLVADFFGAIKKNWKQALIVGIINLVVTALDELESIACLSDWLCDCRVLSDRVFVPEILYQYADRDVSFVAFQSVSQQLVAVKCGLEGEYHYYGRYCVLVWFLFWTSVCDNVRIYRSGGIDVNYFSAVDGAVFACNTSVFDSVLYFPCGEKEHD